MKALLLAAGYATRLYPLTENFPKPLLPVAGQPILSHLLRKLERVDEVDEACVVTNARFFEHFRTWADNERTRLKITVLNDGTTSNENRLGAIGDIAFALENGGLCGHDLIVLAGDNLFDFELTDFVASYRERPDARAMVTVHVLEETERLKRTGVATVNEDGRVTSFKEKPANPPSNLAVPPFYIFHRSVGDLVKEYLDAGMNPDAPGHFLEWLVTRENVYAFRFEGERYDIGDHESYRRTQEIFEVRFMGDRP